MTSDLTAALPVILGLLLSEPVAADDRPSERLVFTAQTCYVFEPPRLMILLKDVVTHWEDEEHSVRGVGSVTATLNVDSQGQVDPHHPGRFHISFTAANFPISNQTVLAGLVTELTTGDSASELTTVALSLKPVFGLLPGLHRPLTWTTRFEGPYSWSQPFSGCSLLGDEMS